MIGICIEMMSRSTTAKIRSAKDSFPKSEEWSVMLKNWPDLAMYDIQFKTTTDIYFLSAYLYHYSKQVS